MQKIRIATEWLGTCSGCEMALLDLAERLLDLLEKGEMVYSPLMDVKEIPSGIDLTLVTGSIRNEEDREKVEKLRGNSKTLVALGSCACFGGIIGLANLFENREIFEKIFLGTKSTSNPEKVIPAEGVPGFEDRIFPVDQVVKVDHHLPGCPPTPEMMATTLFDLLSGKKPELSKKIVCDECKLERKEKKIERVKRWAEGVAKPDECYLDQGYICMGPATRAGCKAPCTSIGFPCRGCLGPTDEVLEQGAKMISALASVLEVDEKEIVKMVYDPMSMFYRFTLPSSIIPRKVRRE